MLKMSIISASHNQIEWIGHCMRSVISQDYQNFEFIVLDDCSTDRTFKRACEISKKHDNVKVMRNDKRMYCGATYKKLLSMVTGDIIGIVDGDDCLRPSAMKTIVKYYEQYPRIDFIWSNHRWWNSKRTKFRNGISNKPRRGTIFDSEEGFKHVYSHWRTFRTELRDRAELFDPNLKCTVDKNLGYVLEEISHGAFLNKQLYDYYYHEGNMSRGSGYNQKSKWREVRKKHRNKNRNKSIILK